jgi:hypothetical protein
VIQKSAKFKRKKQKNPANQEFTSQCLVVRRTRNSSALIQGVVANSLRINNSKFTWRDDTRPLRVKNQSQLLFLQNLKL